MLPPVYLKAYCRPLKACNFYFSTDQLKHLQKIWQLQKKRKSKSRLDQTLCQFLFFHVNVIFDKLSKLGQISCVIPYYIEIKDSLYLGKFFVNLLNNWFKMKRLYLNP